MKLLSFSSLQTQSFYWQEAKLRSRSADQLKFADESESEEATSNQKPPRHTVNNAHPPPSVKVGTFEYTVISRASAPCKS